MSEQRSTCLKIRYDLGCDESSDEVVDESKAIDNPEQTTKLERCTAYGEKAGGGLMTGMKVYLAQKRVSLSLQ